MNRCQLRGCAGLALCLTLMMLPVQNACSASRRLNVLTMGAKGDGITDDTTALNAAITSAIKSGPGATVFLPKGTYRIASLPGGPRSLVVESADGLTIEGEAGSRIMIGSGSTAFELRHCKRLTVRRLVIDRDPLLFTQGTINTADPAAQTCEVTLQKGYDDLDAPQFKADVTLKPFIYPGADNYQQDHNIPGVESRERIGERKWRFHFKTNGVIGDWVGKPCLMCANGTGWCFTGRDLENWTVEDVEYCGGGGQAAWYLSGLTGTTTFRRFMVRVPPGSDRLDCCAGGGQIGGLRGKLLIENSEFTRIDDDGLDILAGWVRVLGQPGPRTLNLQRGDLAAGDHIALWNWISKRSRSEAVVVSAAPGVQGGQTVILDREVRCDRTGAGNGEPFGGDADADGIDRVIDLDATGQETVVRDCKYQVFRAKCLNLKAKNCTVERCTFMDSWQSPISASPEWYFEEGPPVQNLTVRDCTFTNCVHSNIEVGSIRHEQIPPLTPTPSPAEHPEWFGHETRNILIEGNRFRGYGTHVSDYPWVPVGDAIRVMNADNVTIRNNDFGKAAATHSPKLILIGCTHLKIENNHNLHGADIEQR